MRYPARHLPAILHLISCLALLPLALVAQTLESPSNVRAFMLPAEAVEILLAWDASPGATYYRVYRAEADRRWRPIASNIREPRFRDTDFLSWPSSPCYYQVVAVSAAGEMAASVEIPVEAGMQQQPLIRLSQVSVRPVADTAMSIRWGVEAPLYNQWGWPASGGALGMLELGTTPANLALVGWTADFAQSQEFILSDLEPATVYWYRLTLLANNDTGLTYLSSFVTQPFSEPTPLRVSLPNGSPGLVTDEDTPIPFTLTSDDPAVTLSFAITQQPLSGRITGTSPYFIFTPDLERTGPDYFGTQRCWTSRFCSPAKS